MALVGEVTPNSENAVDACGAAKIFTPPASATSALPVRKSFIAWFTATREEEHAVSTLMEGPRKSRA